MQEEEPEDEGKELGGRVNTDMEFEDAVVLMLSTDLREKDEDERDEA